MSYILDISIVLLKLKQDLRIVNKRRKIFIIVLIIRINIFSVRKLVKIPVKLKIITEKVKVNVPKIYLLHFKT